jgi:hypothetical protein
MDALKADRDGVLETLSPLIFLTFVSLCFVSMAVLIGFDADYWGDEEHFVQTIRHFGKQPNFATFSDYDQIAGPLVFAIYGLWGKLTSFDTASLRHLNVAISIITLMMIFRWYMDCLPKKSLALLACLVLLLNPYIWGLGFFVFTDMPTLFFVVVMAISVRWKRPLVLFIAGAAALLCRQYVAFLFLASGSFYLLNWYNSGRVQWRMLFALVIGCIPLFILVLIWKGIAPPSGMRRWVMDDGQLYHLGYLTTYVTFLAFYTLPLMLIMWRSLIQRASILIVTLPMSSWYFLFPVRPSIATITQTEHDTVGLAHRLIKYLFHGSGLDVLVLWLLFWCGLILLANLLVDDFKKVRVGVVNYSQFLSLTIVSFLLVMPFSFQLWEKYLVIILPFLVLRSMIYFLGQDQTELL